MSITFLRFLFRSFSSRWFSFLTLFSYFQGLLQSSECFNQSEQHLLLCSVLHLGSLVAIQLTQVQNALRTIRDQSILSTTHAPFSSKLVELHAFSNIPVSSLSNESPNSKSNLPLLFMSISELHWFLMTNNDSQLSIVVSEAYESACYSSPLVHQEWSFILLLQVSH